MKSIYGPNDERLIWNEQWGRDKELRTALVGEPVTMSDAALRAWMAQSDRRNYLHADGERRIFLTSSKSDGDQVYVTPEAPHMPQVISAEDRVSWRKDAQ